MLAVLVARGADWFAAEGNISGVRWPQPVQASAATQTSAVGNMPLSRAWDEGATTLEQMQFGICQILTTMTASSLSDAQYRQIAGDTLALIEAHVDRWMDADVIDIDTHRTGGLLELSFPNGSKIILNTQPPLQELWLAAKGGGFHFRYDGIAWVDTRDGQAFATCLSQHASAQAGKPLRFDLG